MKSVCVSGRPPHSLKIPQLSLCARLVHWSADHHDPLTGVFDMLCGVKLDSTTIIAITIKIRHFDNIILVFKVSQVSCHLANGHSHRVWYVLVDYSVSIARIEGDWEYSVPVPQVAQGV